MKLVITYTYDNKEEATINKKVAYDYNLTEVTQSIEHYKRRNPDKYRKVRAYYMDGNHTSIEYYDIQNNEWVITDYKVDR